MSDPDDVARPGPGSMNPSAPFVLRPVATSLLMAAIVLAGLVSFWLLPVSALPEVDYPTIQVRTLYPGASPEVVAHTVTAPLERQFGQMSGLKRMSSTSAAGASVITLQFDLNLTLDIAEQQVQAAINAGGTLLPTGLPAPPVYSKVNPADSPILTLSVTSDTLPLTNVQDLVDTRLAQKISQVSGVGLVSLSGGNRPAVRIQVDTNRLAAYGLGIDSLRTTINAANTNSAKGSFDGATRAYTINANDQLLTVDDYRNLIIAYRNDAPIRLSTVANVVDGAENKWLGAWAGTAPAIIVNVQRQPGANVIATVDAIKALLPELQRGLPAGVRVNVLSDRTAGIRASVRDVEIELALAVVLVVLVIFFFLHSIQATIIASLAVPISLIGTLGAMYLLGYSINNLSLMALTIATGFVVDDAIVVIENIARYLRQGNSPIEAALKGSKQIGFTIISLTVSLIAVLIPLLFMGDVIGRLFREFAVTLALTIVISAVVSLTLTPMLAARWLKPEPDEKTVRRSQSWVERVVAGYDRSLGWVLGHQSLTLVVATVTLALTVALYVYIPKGLFPTQDTGELQAEIHVARTVSYAKMAEVQQEVAKAILQDPDVRSLSSFIGVDGSNTTLLGVGRMLINLKDARTTRQPATMARLKERAETVPGITFYVQPVQDLTIDAETGPTQYRLSLSGVETIAVNEWAQKLTDALQDVPEVRNATTEAGALGYAAFVEVDRDAAARVNVTLSTLDETLYSAFGQRIVSTIFTETNQYRVILEARPGLFSQPQDLGQLRLPTVGGGTTPLSVVTRIRERAVPLQITHVAQFPAATIGFDTAPGISLGGAVDAIRTAAQEIGIPAGIGLSFLGAASAYQASLQNELWLILAAIVCVYIVLGVLYESFIHPLTILSTLPSAGVGALLALMITGSDLGIIGIIGIILLIGIVKKNAIMMIDFAIDAERNEGKSAEEAIRQAALLRFRPILMTTLAALFAAVPLMVGWGHGSELRNPLGVSIFGGLVLSQILTLFTTPVIYLAFDRLARRGGERTDHGPAREAPAP